MKSGEGQNDSAFGKTIVTVAKRIVPLAKR